MLSDSQTDLYTDTVNIWRATPVIDATTGKGGAATWALVASAVPCYLQTGVSQQLVASFIRIEADNMDTFDVLHCEASVDLLAGDVLKITAGEETGEWRRVEGEPKVRSRLANKQTVLCARNFQPPTGVS